MSGPRVLIVDDDETALRSLGRCLTREGCQVIEVDDGQTAVNSLDAGAMVDLVVSDLEMPGADGRRVVEAARRRGFPVVILTGHNSVEEAVELIRSGASNYLIKPFSPSMVRSILDSAFGPGWREREEQRHRRTVGQDARFVQVLELVDQVADTDATVLIRGETGTGKEVVAQEIHASSLRSAGPFIAVNCAAIPEQLFESEFFGHTKGAFTGATHARPGRFQLAEGGTLFLDEIGDMPLAFQVKLLRALQERRIEMLGEGTARPVDVRVIAATHRDLRQMIREGKFREDLYYRLAVVELTLPPLRERISDLPLLLDHFIQAANQRHGRSVSGVTPAALEALSAYAWPGNIRELGNVVERLVIFRRAGEIDRAHLPAELLGGAPGAQVPAELPDGGINLRQAVEELEDSLITQALARTGGNRKAAAELLGLNRTTLVERLRRRGS